MTIRMTRRESRWRVAPLALRFWRGQRTAWLSAEADASLKAARGATSPSCGRSCAPEAAIGCSQPSSRRSPPSNLAPNDLFGVRPHFAGSRTRCFSRPARRAQSVVGSDRGQCFPCSSQQY
jgi:hypothetical protein